jgi:hypothetical protein
VFAPLAIGTDCIRSLHLLFNYKYNYAKSKCLSYPLRESEISSEVSRSSSASSNSSLTANNASLADDTYTQFKIEKWRRQVVWFHKHEYLLSRKATFLSLLIVLAFGLIMFGIISSTLPQNQYS